MSRFAIGVDLGTTNSVLAFSELEGDAALAGAADSPGRRALDRGRAPGPAVLPLPGDRPGDERQRLRPALGAVAIVCGRRVRLPAVGPGAGTHALGAQVLAVPQPRRPPPADPALERSRGGGQDLAGRGLAALPRAPAGSLERGPPGGPVRRAAGRPDGAGVVRRRGPRAHPGGGPGGRLSQGVDAARGAPGGALLLARRHGRGLAPGARRGRRAAGLRRRWRHHRLLPDPGGRGGGRADPRAGRGRQPHPGGRRQHGPRAGAPRHAGVRRAGHLDRRLAVGRPVALVPRAKEAMLAEGGPATHPVTIPGRGSKLIGGAISVELSRDDVHRILVDGFFPRLPPRRRAGAAARLRVSRRSGCRSSPTPPSPATWPISSAPMPRPAAARRRRGPPTSSSTAAVSRPTPSSSGSLEVLGSWFEGGSEDPQAGARGGSRLRRGPRRGLLRLRQPRRRHPHPRRRRPLLLRRHRDRGAGGTGHAAAAEGALRGAVRHGGGQRDRRPGSGDRPGRRRAGLASASSARASARRTPPAPSSTPGGRTSWSRPTPWRPPSRRRPASRAGWCRCASAPASPSSGFSSCGA